MSRLFYYLIVLGLCTISACQKPLFTNTDDEQPNNNGEANWTDITFSTERILQNIFGTPFQLYAISENQFFRFDADNELLEKRSLAVDNGVKGRPALSDNVFVRMTTTPNFRQHIEFHSTRNPAAVVKILADSLKNAADDHIEVEFLARTLGAFSDDGVLFLLATKTFPNTFYTFFLFEITMNAAHDEFVSIEVLERIDVPSLGADFANIVSIRSINGNFYISTKEGAYRITEEGVVSQIFPQGQWMLDFFPFEGDIYVTGINTFDLHRSEDNGETWERLNQNSELKMVEAEGDNIFSHQVVGHAFRLVEDDLLNTKSIKYPTEVDPENLSAFNGISFYNNQYYILVDRAIYFTDVISTE